MQARTLPLGEIGPWDVTIISGGRFRTDGGAMFGVVPKSLWSRAVPCDDGNLIAQDTNCLLLRSKDSVVVVDCGYGGKISEKQRQWMHAETGDPLLESLTKAAVAPEEVTDVVFSHLHYDHCGGASRLDPETGGVALTFPHATHHVQRLEWELAHDTSAELRGAYPQDNIQALEGANWRFLDGESRILPSMTGLPCPGHTAGHQAIFISDGSKTLVYLGDLVPTTHHLPTLWCMGYDVDLLATRRNKNALLGRAADEQWTVVLNHDPDCPAAMVRRHDRKGFGLDRSIAMWENA